jgi:hypothetical protein
VVAEAQLSCADGSSDPFGYRQLVDDLIWSVQKTAAQKGRTRRLVQMIPGLLQRLRDGLHGIGYPPELTQRFFDHLITLHRAAVQDGRDAAEAKKAQEAADAAWAEESQFGDSEQDEVQMWLDENEAQESGYLDSGPDMETERVASPEAVQQEAERAAAEEERAREAAAEVEAAAAAAAMFPGQDVEIVELSVDEPLPELPRDELRIGTWVEIQIKGEWVRAQLTWCSPHSTLFMFTSIGGAAHSMSRRTLDKLRGNNQLRVVADRPVVDEALDQVAQAALKNSIGKK